MQFFFFWGGGGGVGGIKVYYGRCENSKWAILKLRL